VRRRLAATILLFAAARASADDAPSADAIRAARTHVLSRSEFRYAAPEGKSFVEEIWGGWTEWLHRFYAAYPTLVAVAFCALALLLIALVAHIVWTLRMARRAEWEVDAAIDLDAALRRGDPAPFRARAVEHAAAGRLVDAVRDLYAALLLTLDRKDVVRYARHKALLDYRIEAARDADAVATLDLFAATYHPGSFGRRPPDRAHFDELLAALDRVAGTPR